MFIKPLNDAPEGKEDTILFEGKEIPAKIFTMKSYSGEERFALVYPPFSFHAAVRVVRL